MEMTPLAVARKYLKTGPLRKAFDAAVKAPPSLARAKVFAGLGDRYAATHLINMAEQSYGHAIADAGRAGARDLLARALASRGWIRLNLQDHRGALLDLDAALAMTTTFEAHFNRAQVRAELDDIAGAEADYGAALLLRPDDRDARAGRGRMRVLLKRYEEAIPDLADPRADSERLARAMAHQALGRHEDAARDFLAMETKPADTLTRLGVALNALRRHDEARRHLDEAVRLDPKLPEAWFNRAQSRMELGDLKGALADLTKSIALKPGEPQYLLERGNIRKRLGQRAAKADLERALTLAPADWEYRAVAERLLQDVKRA